MDLESLEHMYDQEVALFKEKLLSGEPWETLQEQRELLNHISVALYEKIQGLN
jgi:hypothetical protein